MSISAPETAPGSQWTIQLHCQEGSADKVYHIMLDPAPGGFLVNFLYGRRGSALKAGSKTAAGPVTFSEAKTIVNKLLKEKISGGYNPIEMAGSKVASYERPDDTGIRPMLLEPVDIEDEATIKSLLRGADYWEQEKFNGDRRFVIVSADGSIYGANRKGNKVALPISIVETMEAQADVGIYDGEQVGDIFYVWDILQHGDEDVRSRPYHQRLAHLIAALGSSPDLVFINDPYVLPGTEGGSVRIAKTAKTPASKQSLFDFCQASNKEGVSFKDPNAVYKPSGRDTSAIKVKFWETLSAIVGRVNNKRSVSLVLYDNGHPLPVGNVTIPPNQEIPEPGQVIEVRYLYAYPNGSLYQTGYLGPRHDISAEECLASQRKFVESTYAGPGMSG